ncbi:MAG: 2-oxo acid dehydrogenase subunit E2 [Nanoarchaeota archaeon]
MSFEFKFPDVGEGIVEGKLIKWLVKEGDIIKQDQNIAEVETDKAVVEIPSPKAGTVEKLLYKETDTVLVGKPIMRILEMGESGQKKEGVPVPAIEQCIPVEKAPAPGQRAPSKQATEGITASNNQVLAMPAVRKYAQETGIDLSLVPASGKEGNVTIEDVDRSLGGQSGTQRQPPARAPFSAPVRSPAPTIPYTPQRPLNIAQQPAKDVLATPATRQYARELGVDITTVKGAGPLGQVTREDVQKATQIQPTPSLQRPARSTLSYSIPNECEERVPMPARRLAIARRTMESKEATVTVTVSDEADLTELVAIREKEKQVLAEKGIKLTYLPFFIKAVVIALQNHPYFNAAIDVEKREIILKKKYHIGIATDTPDGLIVPVIKDADKKSITDLAAELGILAQKARENKLTRDEITGSTFSISSLGNIGAGVFTTVLNYPEVSILGIGTIKDKPAARNGKVEIRKLCTFSLGFDHRIVDGADASRFLQTIIKHLEDPDLLFMEMD